MTQAESRLAAFNPWTGSGSGSISGSKTAQKVSAKVSGTLYVSMKGNAIGNS